MGLTAFSLILLPLSLMNLANPIRLIQIGIFTGVFEAAAAIIVGSFGVQPALVPSLLFLTYVCGQYTLGMRYPGEKPVIWATMPLIALLCYAIFSAVTLPSIFAGTVMVWPQKQDFVSSIPLAPSSGNITQSLYLTLNILVVIFGAMFLTQARVSYVLFLKSYLASGYLVVVLSFWQAANRVAGVPFPSDILYSNPGWAIVEQSMGSIPRIQGPFTEPAALAQYLCGVVYSCMWLSSTGCRLMRPGFLLILSLATILLSTSTTGILFILVFVPAMLVYGLVVKARQGDVWPALTTALVWVGAIVFLACLVVLMNPEILTAVDVVYESIVNKQESDSYLERTAINDDAIKAAFATYGLGVGWGSFRAVQFLPGLLANGGVIGLVTVAWFTMRVVSLTRFTNPRSGSEAGGNSELRLVIGGFGAALIAQLIAAMMSGTMITSVSYYLQLACVIGAASRARISAREQARLKAGKPSVVLDSVSA
jgi:hypothetical protein